MSDNWALGLRGLALFRGLRGDAVVARFLALAESAPLDEAQRTDAYGAFVAALYAAGGNWGDHLQKQVLESENPVVRLRAQSRAEPPEMAQALQRELDFFTRLSSLSWQQAAALAGLAQAVVPAFATTAHNMVAEYTRRLGEVHKTGYGVFALYHMFTLGQDGVLCPVKNPDPQRLEDLTGYERERGQVLLNTRALLRGLPANNILLYGDAGTGKSSTVKAIGNAFAAEGLRLIEVRKNQLYQIPTLMDKLAENPLKFVLFIDDLSFPADDGDFTALKAILEGNISARPHNIVVYATSNRRHMVQERFSDRMGEDVHISATIEEATSLSARFGLTITFLKPDRELYTSIVLALAREYGLATPRDELLAQAERHAIRYGGRSPRTARQFVELMKAQETL